MLIRVFLHAEFISAMKTVQILRFLWKMEKNRRMISFGNFCSTIFVKNAKKKKKKIEKWLVLVISVNFLRFSLKLLSRISEKVIKNVFRWKRRQIKEN